jgi:outer membrane receptor protein involved in Fe transport
MLRLNLLVLFSFFMSVYGLAQDEPTTNKDTTQLHDILHLPLTDLVNMKVFAGSKLDGLKQKDIPNQITLISREEISLTGARNLPELISLVVPGAMAVADADDYIFGFRGFAPDNNSMVKILVNGQDAGFSANQNSSTMMSLLDLNFIERLEVITGPGSSVFGSGPLLGVINIITTGKTSDPRENAFSGIRYGTGNLLDGFVHFRSIAKNGAIITADWSMFQQTEGYKPLKGNANWTIPQQTVREDKYHESGPGYSAFMSIEKNETQLSFYTTKFLWDSYQTSIPDALKDMRTVGFKFLSKFNLSKKWKFTPSVFLKNIYFDALVSEDQPYQTANYGDELNLGAEMKFEYSGAKLKAVAGFMVNQYWEGYETYGGANHQYLDPSVPIFSQDGMPVARTGNYIQFVDQMKRTDLDVYAEGKYSFLPNHSIHVSGLISVDDACGHTNFSPKLAYLGKNGNFWWKALYTFAFRTPLPMATGDLPAGGFFRHYINKDLKTQTVSNTEIHFGFSNNNYSLQLVSFYDINKGIIMAGGFPELVPNFDRTKFVWTFANGGNINTYGFELSAEWKNEDKFVFKVSHSMVKIAKVDFENYLKAELYADFKGKHLLSYPENMTKCSFTYLGLPKLKFRTDFLIDYGRYRSNVAATSSISDPNMVFTGLKTLADPWYNLNAGVIYSPFKKLDADFHIYNLLNSRPYQSVVHTNNIAITPYQRSFSISLKYKLF